jgi:hypothetical protein
MTADTLPLETEAMVHADAVAAAPAASTTEPADAAIDPPAGTDPGELKARPEGVPEKFWDASLGTVRTEALLKSYCELERKVGRMIPLPAEDADLAAHERLRQALGVPADAAGFSQRQAQMVYDLAGDYVVPLLNQALAEVEAERSVERLAAHFGGEEQWRTRAGQIKTWGKANLPADSFEVLCSSPEGVLAMHQMMQASEPSVMRSAEAPSEGPDEGRLQTMMRDPRYWRDRDPALIREVTEGFRRLYSK